jgi:plastocyanin
VSKRLALGALFAALLALGVGGVANAQATVSMTAVEFAFQPSTVNVSSGTVTFTLRNDGQFPHNIAFDGREGTLFGDNLASGQSASATITLPPGTYTFYCPVDAHRDRGMVGTLTIASAQAARAGGLDPVVLSGGLAVLGAVLLAGGVLRRRGVV